jgi:hypothetical protein
MTQEQFESEWNDKMRYPHELACYKLFQEDPNAERPKWHPWVTERFNALSHEAKLHIADPSNYDRFGDWLVSMAADYVMELLLLGEP